MDTAKRKNRRKMSTEERKGRLLSALEIHYTVTGACKKAGVARSVAYKWRKMDQDFAEKWIDAQQAALDHLEGSAFAHANRGNVSLIKFLLRTHRPEIFSEKYQRIECRVLEQANSVIDQVASALPADVAQELRSRWEEQYRRGRT